MSVDGIDPRVGEAYPDMCLVSNSASYTQTGEYIISFVYETLTAVWTKEQEDKVTSVANGLRVIDRSEVAKAATTAPYDEDSVGVATITDGGKTLYLAGFRNETSTNPDFQIGRFITTWTEAGLISKSRRSIGQGIYSVSSTFLAQEGSTVGPVINRETKDIDGLKVVSVTTYQDSAGNSISATDGSDNLVHSFDSEENFTIPGVVRIKTTSYHSSNIAVLSSDGYTRLIPGTAANYGFDLIKPAVTVQRVRNYIFYTTDPYISDSDYQYDPGDGAAVGHWNPVDWAKSTISGASADGSPFYESKAYGNYRAANATNEFTTEVRNARYNYSNPEYTIRPTVLVDNDGQEVSQVFINGYKMATKPSPIISVEGGPENPVGSRWTLSVDVGRTPSFEDLNGNSYYKKVIKICDVKGRGIDEELLQDFFINRLGSYTFTDEGDDFYSIALHESYEEVDDFYNGNEIVISVRNQTARNNYTDSIKSMIYDYDSSTNKILIKSSTALSGNYAGRYTDGDVTNINNFNTPKFTMVEHSVESKIVRISRQSNFGTAGGTATIFFDPTISTSGLDDYSIRFTSGECNGLTAPIRHHFTQGTESNASYILMIYCSDASFSGLSLAEDDTFVLVSPKSFS
jgi:hypothetical protein